MNWVYSLKAKCEDLKNKFENINLEVFSKSPNQMQIIFQSPSSLLITRPLVECFYCIHTLFILVSIISIVDLIFYFSNCIFKAGM